MDSLNRKGFVLSATIIIAIAVAILMLVFGVSVLINKRFLFTAIGVAGIVLTLIYVVPSAISGNLDSRKSSFVLILFGIFSIFILISAFDLIPQVEFNPTEYIQAPLFATIECQQSGTSKDYSSLLLTSGTWISDNLPKNTNEWSVSIKAPSSFSVAISHQLEYYICPQRGFTNCNRQLVTISSPNQQVNLGVVPSTSYIWAQYKKSYTGINYVEDSGAQYNVVYKPFILIRDDVSRGGRQELSDNLGCVVPAADVSWLNRVISTTLSGKSIATTNVLRPGERFNYITGTFTRIADGNTQAGGYCIYNNGRATIFQIDKITTPSGSYNIVNVDRPLSYPQCCNGQSVPGSTCQNGVLIPIETAECRYSSDCGSIEFIRDPVLDKTVYRYTCSSGKCVKQTQNVQCSTDRDCPTNSRCNTNSWTCQIAATDNSGNPLGGEGIVRGEDVPINIDKNTCLAKAEANPLVGYTWVETTTPPSLGEQLKYYASFGLIGNNQPTTSSKCEKAYIPYYIIGVILGIITILIIYLTSNKRKKRKK